MSFVHVLLTVVALLSILCIIVVLFFERKNPSSSLVWVLVLTFLPVIGFVAYLFLGTGFRVNKRKRYALKAMNDEMYNRFIVKHLDLHDKPVVVDQHESYGRMLNYLKRQGEGFFTRDNAAKVYVE
ncbi:MAG: PLDc N-terminal domain-containing protein, partial [Planctomycetes bacterium]|nr:PLDc N-terminal domain-containing protein [Planctomycetota bacterium]